MKCWKCGEHGPEHSFETYVGRNGKVGRRGVCKTCRGKRAKENFDKLQAWRKGYNAKNRTVKREKDVARRTEARDFVNALKDRPCADCGKKWPPVAMDFDHAVGAKIKSVASMVSQAYKLDLIIEEIEKCEVVCACCHRLRTAARKEGLAHIRWTDKNSARTVKVGPRRQDTRLLLPFDKEEGES